MKKLITLLVTVIFAASGSDACAQSNDVSPKGKLKIMVVGAHPDDPETAMGGTILKYTRAGNEVVVVYLTTGEAGIQGTIYAEAAKIRKAEALEACKIMGARPVFFGQIDGNCVLTPEWYQKMKTLFDTEKPDMVFTHWPIDSHRDHRICADLVYDAWYDGGKKQAFYYFEVCTGGQTQNYNPDTRVDISEVVQQKWNACFVHKSQQVKETYSIDHAKMELFRGIEINADYAEGFVHHWQSPIGILP